MRRTVMCWYCGHRARKVPNPPPTLMSPLVNRQGRMRVVGSRRTVVPYGVCGAILSSLERCTEVMLLPEDAAFVLRAAIAHERRGGNCMSEFDEPDGREGA